MKKIFLIIALLYSVNGFSQIKEASLKASGLTCSLCSKAIYKALTAIQFINEVKPNIQNSTYIISFKSGVQPDFDLIAKAVTNAGFSVAQLKLVVNFDNISINNNMHIKIENKEFHFLNVHNETLKGDRTIILIDKNFISARDYKKYSSLDEMKCYQTGVVEDCCPKKDSKKGERIYHVTI